MAQHSRETRDRSPATLPGPGIGTSAAHRLLSLDIVLALLALTGGLRVLYLAAPEPALPSEAATVAHAYALGHLTSFTDAGGAGVSRFGWLQLGGGNLLVPIVTHALYDIVALRLLLDVKETPPSSVL